VSRACALVVDDEPDILELLEITLARMDIEARACADLAAAYEAARAGGVDLCLTDMRLPDGSGIDLVRFMHRHRPEVPVAVITAHGSVESAVEALKAGAFDFVSKPVDLEALRALIEQALRLAGSAPVSSRRLVGRSAAMERVRETIAKLARSQAPVLISGESGTGKELVARMIHEQGPRAQAPFVPVNCGAIPLELMESELFGHRRGSFTGAVSNKAGLFKAADGGTLFLDEVAELPLAMQVKLLRAIQEKAVRPVGEEREVRVDVRILSASHQDLAEQVRSGRFRQDLYYRLDVIELHVPPLRERREDIPELARHIAARLAEESGLGPPELSDEALEALCAYPFPGNVRELENILERAMTLCEGKRIEAADLGLAPARGVADRPPGARPLDSVLDDVAKGEILAALARTGGNKRAAARLLGIGLGKLRYQMQKLGME